MDYFYQRAGIEDIELLVGTRTEVLRAANGLDDSTDMTEVETKSRAYYLRTLKNGSHTAYLVFDGSEFIGAGGISFYTVMPTYHNPTGKKSYIMNMYTAPTHRRKGIATKMLDLLVQDAEDALRKEGITKIFGLVFIDNEPANAFWEEQGYTLRTNLNYRNKSLNKKVPQGE